MRTVRGSRVVVLAASPFTLFWTLLCFGLVLESVSQGYYDPLLLVVGWVWSSLVAVSVWLWRRPGWEPGAGGAFLMWLWGFFGRGMIGTVLVAGVTAALIGAFG